eukprot:g59980.t1
MVTTDAWEEKDFQAPASLFDFPFHRALLKTAHSFHILYPCEISCVLFRFSIVLSVCSLFPVTWFRSYLILPCPHLPVVLFCRRDVHGQPNMTWMDHMIYSPCIHGWGITGFE